MHYFLISLDLESYYIFHKTDDLLLLTITLAYMLEYYYKLKFNSLSQK